MARAGYCRHDSYIANGAVCRTCEMEKLEALEREEFNKNAQKHLLKQNFIELLNEDKNFALEIKNILDEQ